MSAAVSTATMRPSLIAMPPFSITRREPSIVTTVPPRMIRSTGISLRWATVGIIDAQITKAATTNFADANLFIALSLAAALQKPGVKRLRQKLSDIDDFTLPLQIRQRDLGVLGVFPDNLPASAARRSQLFGVDDNHEIGEIAFTFRQRLPNRHAFGADGQAVTRAFDVAAGVNLSGRRAQRCAHQKIRE